MGFPAARFRARSRRLFFSAEAVSCSASWSVSSLPAYREKFKTSFSPRRRMEPSSITASQRPATRWEGFSC